MSRSIELLWVTSQSIADDVTNTLRAAPIVAPTCKNRYPNRYLSILFTVIFTGGRVKNFSSRLTHYS